MQRDWHAKKEEWLDMKLEGGSQITQGFQAALGPRHFSWEKREASLHDLGIVEGRSWSESMETR